MAALEWPPIAWKGGLGRWALAALEWPPIAWKEGLGRGSLGALEGGGTPPMLQRDVALEWGGARGAGGEPTPAASSMGWSGGRAPAGALFTGGLGRITTAASPDDASDRLLVRSQKNHQSVLLIVAPASCHLKQCVRWECSAKATVETEITVGGSGAKLVVWRAGGS